MADRYTKNNILQYPKLEPVRHYESENVEPFARPGKDIQRPDKLLETLDDLDNIYKMTDLLPPDLAANIKEITDILSKHTQGLILMRLKQEILHPKKEPEKKEKKPVTPPIVIPTKAKPSTSNLVVVPKTHTPDVTKWTTKGYEYEGPQPGSKHDSHTKGYGPNDYHFNTYDVLSTPDVWPPKRETWGTGEHQETTKIIYDNPGTSSDGWGFDGQPQKDTSYTDAYVDDIFSAEPEVEIELEPTESLVDLARKGYMQDDADIKEHYTTMMSQLSQRFFQVMTALAEDANMIDYSNLMEDFDGTAVTTSDPNQRHLIDEICRNQVLYDQKLRQMNLTHTAEHTLVMTRAMTAAEGERERYLSENYKTNMPTISAGLSNDVLQKAREDSEKKYQNAAYNYYKYLDSATKYTNSMLNMKIDSAIAKAELANTGSDIFAVTPPPEPLPDNVDDNFDTVNKYQDKQQKMIDEQKKDSKKASELDDGININGTSGDPGSSSSSSGDHNVTVGPGPGKGKENIPSDAEPWTVDMAMRCSNKCGIPCDWLWGQWANESGHFQSPCGSHNWGGVLGENFDSDDAFADYMAKILPRWVSAEGVPANQAKTFKEYIHCLQTDPTPYCASPPGEETYYAACSGALGNAGTVLS